MSQLSQLRKKIVTPRRKKISPEGEQKLGAAGHFQTRKNALKKEKNDYKSSNSDAKTTTKQLTLLKFKGVRYYLGTYLFKILINSFNPITSTLGKSIFSSSSK